MNSLSLETESTATRNTKNILQSSETSNRSNSLVISQELIDNLKSLKEFNPYFSEGEGADYIKLLEILKQVQDYSVSDCAHEKGLLKHLVIGSDELREYSLKHSNSENQKSELAKLDELDCDITYEISKLSNA